MERYGPILAVLVVLVVGGCVGLLGGGGDVDPATVDEQVETELSDVESLQMTMNQTVRTENGTDRLRFRVRYERPRKVNYTVIGGDVSWTYAVSNASGTWIYDAANGTAHFSPTPLVSEPADLFYGATDVGPNATFEGNETLAGEDAVELSYAVSNETVSLVVGGDRTSQLDQSAGNGSLRTRVWFDTDLWLPRKVEVELAALSDDHTVTVRYENVTVGGETPEGTFRFDPPAGTTVRERDRGNFRVSPENATVFESRSDLVAATDLSVPDPSVPPDFEFHRGTLFDSHHRGVELTYSNGTGLIEVVVVRGNESFVSAGGTMTVGDVAGTYAELPRSRLVQWHCGEETRLVATTAGRETLRSVAGSVGCAG